MDTSYVISAMHSFRFPLILFYSSSNKTTAPTVLDVIKWRTFFPALLWLQSHCCLFRWGEKNSCLCWGNHAPATCQSQATGNGLTSPNIKHFCRSLGEDDIQCHQKTLTNDSIFLSIKATVCNVASDLRGRWTPWHQTQDHVMASLSPWVLINTRQRDHGQSSGHYHSSLSSLVCLCTDVEESIITACAN